MPHTSYDALYLRVMEDGYILISLINLDRPSADEASFDCLQFHSLSALIQVASEVSVFGKGGL